MDAGRSVNEFMFSGKPERRYGCFERCADVNDESDTRLRQGGEERLPVRGKPFIIVVRMCFKDHGSLLFRGMLRMAGKSYCGSCSAGIF